MMEIGAAFDAGFWTMTFTYGSIALFALNVLAVSCLARGTRRRSQPPVFRAARRSTGE